MRWFRILGDRLRGLFGRERVTGEIHDELAHHLDLAAAEHERRGLSPAEARAAAMRQLGNVPLLQDRGYDVRGGGVVEATLRDARFAFRLMRRQPAFSLIALMTIALGIGATSTIFGVANGVLLKPLPYPDAGRLAMVWMNNQRLPLREDWHSLPNIQDYRDANKSFEAIAVYRNRSMNLTGAGEAQMLTGAANSPNLFSVLGVQPHRGRVFTDAEDRPEQDGVVVLSYGLWKRAFGGDDGVVGRSVVLNGRSRQVIGVMPEGFAFPSASTEFWTPLAPTEQLRTSRNSLWLMAIGRLKPGVGVPQAQADLEIINADILRRFPAQDGYGIYTVGYHDQLVARTRPAIIALLGAVGFLLLIACVNVANLLLSRASVREREVALRTAIGAGRMRLIRQLLTESALLAIVGGMVGVGLAWLGMRTLVATAPPELPRLADITLDVRVIAFTFGIALLTGLVFGLVPALQISRTGLGQALKEGGRSSSFGVGRAVRRALVVVQVALALVLLTGAGLMVQSFLRLQRVDIGFDPANVLTLEVTLAGQSYQQPPEVNGFFTRLVDGVRAVPGVDSAALISALFLSSTPNSTAFNIEGRPVFTAAESVEVPFDSVSPGYFSTMGIPVKEGREFTASDSAQAGLVAIINDTMARRFWPNESPIGRRFTYGQPGGPNTQWWTIVGVVGDTRRVGYDAPIRPETYVPLAQQPSRSMMLVVRSAKDPISLAASIRGVVASIDAAQPVHDVATVEQLLGNLTAERRLNTILFGLFACVAALLAAAGIYGVIAYSVEQRTRELGVRLALGAKPREVFSLVLKEGLVLAVIGVIAGVVSAFGATQVMRSLLYDTSATDPATYAAMATMALLVALIACLVPALRATRVDPLTALRAD
jgi:putative ABC transport system permease protein